MTLEFYLQLALPVCYDDSDDDASGDTTPTGEDGNGNSVPQDEVNKILATERRKYQEKLRTLEETLQRTVSSSKLSEGEKAELEERLEDVRKQLRTKEEQAKLDRKKLEEEYQRKLADLEGRASNAERNLTEATIRRSLQDAAVEHEAWRPAQLVRLMEQQAKLVEGKVMIDFDDLDSEGKSIQSQMTPSEAFNRMKELPEIYGNLFKSNVVGGIGGTNESTGGSVDYKNISMEDYVRLRKENPKAIGLNRAVAKR